MRQDVVGRSRSANQRRPPLAGVVGARCAAATALLILVLAQAVIAGQSLFATWDIRVHGWLGNGSFLLSVVGAGLAVAARSSRSSLVMAAAMPIVMVGQIGLGYAGRTALPAASWHVPLGVTTFGLALVNVIESWRPTRSATATADESSVP